MSFNLVAHVDFQEYWPLAIIFSIAVLLVWASTSFAPVMDSREPPLVKSKIPFIGHGIGLLLYQAKYLEMLSLKHQMPAFTITVLSKKIYILTSPSLVQTAMRHRLLSFDIFAAEFAERLLGFSPAVMKHLRYMPVDRSEKSFMRDMWSVEHETLMPGPMLHQMNVEVLRFVSELLEKVGAEWQVKPFYLWLRDSFTIATTSAMFGPGNPMTVDPSLIDAYWGYETDQANLLTYPLPSITCKRALDGRRAVQESLRKYYREAHDKDSGASSLIKQRAKVARYWGLEDDDLGDLELNMVFVSTANAIPTLFWVIAYIFRDQKLVEDIRRELMASVLEIKGSEYVINITKFPTRCPLLVSTYNETLRLINMQPGARVPLEDTTLTDSSNGKQFLLKKGNIIQMPANVLHTDSRTWGMDSHSFNARRFMNIEDASQDSRDAEKLQKKAFLPFGGGKHLCPGRHFAYAEILGTVAALVLGYEIEDLNGERVKVPAMRHRFGEGVAKPVLQAEADPLRIRRRPGMENVVWKFIAREV